MAFSVISAFHPLLLYKRYIAVYPGNTGLWRKMRNAVVSEAAASIIIQCFKISCWNWVGAKRLKIMTFSKLTDIATKYSETANVRDLRAHSSTEHTKMQSTSLSFYYMCYMYFRLV